MNPPITIDVLFTIVGASVRGVMALLVVLMTLSEWRRTRRQAFRSLATAFLLLLIHQAVAGGATVLFPTSRLVPPTLHLLESCFLVLLAHAIAVHEQNRRTELERVTGRLFLANLVLALITLGFWLVQPITATFTQFWGEWVFAIWHLGLVGLAAYLTIVLRPEIRVFPALLLLAVGKVSHLANLVVWDGSLVALNLLEWSAGAITAIMLLAAVHFGIIAETYTDPLTRLHNRRFFMTRIGDEFTRAQRRSQPLAILVLDLDHFKRFNDTHGHVIGDKLLKSIATILSRQLRPQDILCRWGGEEFIAVLPNAGAAAAAKVGERWREALAETFGGPDREAPVTVSIGVAVSPDIKGDWRALVEAADEALYEAKNWRNRVVVAKKQKGAARPS